MAREVEFAFDECLYRIAKGEPLEACLASYPECAAELEPLLRTTLELKELREEVPAASLAAVRRRFLKEAARLKKETERQWARRRLDNISSALGGFFLRHSWAPASFIALLLLALSVWGTVAVSARSLPGDPLYQVKLTAERVQLLLAFDPATKVQLEEELAQRRLDEARAVVRRRRTARLTFGGVIERVGEERWVVSGLTITLDKDTILEGQPSPGAPVEVEALSPGDGSLKAKRIRVMGSAPPPSTPTPEPTATHQPTETPHPTETPTTPPTPMPTETPHPTATHTPTMTPHPRETTTPTPSPTSTPTATPSPSPTLTPAPPREIKVKFEGAIESMDEAGGIWVIGGRTVAVSASTTIDEQEGKAKVGAWVRVKAIRRDDGSLLAIRIVVRRPAEAPGEPMEFSDVIESIGPTAWVVGGKTVLIEEGTTIEGTPQVGWLANVKAIRRPDGSIVATEIAVKPPEEMEVEFEGIIESLGETSWVIDETTVLIDAETVIEGSPAVGLRAEVKALLMPDGSLLARRIKVKEE